MYNSIKLMKICRESIPEHTEKDIPDLVHDFIIDRWEEIKQAMGEEV